ncbi:MAG TPA: hypothetical protein VEQ11_06105 [Chloroflexota bacterium]|nr:hypothetical protein [Chloroflexota bacterium]
MDTVCGAIPLQPGKTEAARAFVRELDGPRKPEFAASERRIGITKESWYVQGLPSGDILIVYFESQDPGSAIGQFCASQDPFDRWFKQNLLDVTGVDLNQGMEGPLSERLSSYEA